ncbi:hypothetical protein E4K64_19110 [Bradyrhizobium frederickii]|uniref:Uncharacterized protein n=1 Tax=Bradyrhizobium frederickii TaxID=2560054 RepID=A0A4Y9P5Y4_9BRAD|nr:hypothetical protein [Bradyrhizobium frederickii]TFV74103.1 hypothetical protein E4K64_19110 [Bradyrhizobium frederickii]
MEKASEAAWLFVIALIGVTALGLAVSFLLGHPHHYNLIGKVWVHIVGFAALNGAYISFSAAISGQEPDRPAVGVSGATRLIMFLSGILVVALVWGGLWLVAQ